MGHKRHRVLYVKVAARNAVGDGLTIVVETKEVLNLLAVLHSIEVAQSLSKGTVLLIEQHNILHKGLHHVVTREVETVVELWIWSDGREIALNI